MTDRSDPDRSTAPRADAMDPQARTVVERVESEGFPGWRALGVERARTFEDEVFSGPPTPEVAAVTDHTLDGPRGDLPLRVYRPAPDEARPAVVHFHGGGFALGTLDSVDGICRELAARTGCCVVSVDYHLAPEHVFPAALEDANAALEWVAAHAATVGCDGTLAVSGTSAGGALAAASGLLAADGIGPELAHQCLLYPMLDRDPSRASYGDGRCAWLTAADVAWFWDLYLGEGGAPAEAAPLRAVDSALAGVPPATVVTAGFDPLRDEGAAYVDRLRAVGVDVRHRHYPDQPHGFLSLTDDVERADAAMDVVADDLRAALR